MGTTSSNNNNNNYEATREKPLPDVSATLYYFEGRGVADQIRWVLAAGNITFGQKSVTKRPLFLKMAERQLPFGQLPMLQIDGLELVQTQAIIRYIAKRASLNGTTERDQVKCDMIAEACHDVLSVAVSAPFKRSHGEEEGAASKVLMINKWSKFGTRFEAVLAANGGKFMVGQDITYADILIVHCMTWYVEECGPEIVATLPLLVELQYRVFALPGIQSFLKSKTLYYPLGDNAYCAQVCETLGRHI